MRLRSLMRAGTVLGLAMPMAATAQQVAAIDCDEQQHNQRAAARLHSGFTSWHGV